MTKELMTLKDIESRVKKIIGQHLGVQEDDVKNDTTIEDLGGDSLDQIEIVMDLEDEFRIELSDAEAEKIVTLGSAVEFVASKKKIAA